jgi:hypothetical protein
LVGNLSAPILKPQIDATIAKYFALRKTFLSQHVKIVDNGMCIDTGSNEVSAVSFREPECNINYANAGC